MALLIAIERLCRDSDLTGRMGAAALEMAHRTFSPDRNASDLLALYRSITGETPH